MIGDCMVYLATLVTVIGVVTSSCEPAIVEHVDMVEINHLHDANGKPLIIQWIFWEWYEDESNCHVRLYKEAYEHDREKLMRVGDFTRFDFWDGSTESHRRIFVSHTKESWSQVDPERADKEHVAETERIRLVQRVLKPVEPMILPEVDQ